MSPSAARVVLYITARSVYHGVRRALARPLRALLTLAILGYLAYEQVDELQGAQEDADTLQWLTNLLETQQPLLALTAIAVVVHWWHLVFRIAPAAMDATRGVVRPSDVDFLFATPLSPVRLFRGLALARAMTSAFSLLLPMALYVLLLVESALAQTPHARAAPAVAFLGYPAMCLLAFSAVLLWGAALEAIELSGRQTRRWVRWGVRAWAAACFGLVVGRAVWLALAPNAAAPLDALGQAMNWLPAYALLLPVRGLADAAMVLHQGVTPAIGMGFLLWLGVLLGANRVLARRQPWLYEVGASKAHEHAAEQAAARDPYGACLQQLAQQHENQPCRTPRLWARWTPRGAGALLWRDLLIAWRARPLATLLSLLGMTLAPPVAATLLYATAQAALAQNARESGDWARLLSDEQGRLAAQRLIYALTQGALAIAVALGAYRSFVYTLRRALWQKSLPLRRRAMVVAPVASRTLPFALAQLTAALLACLWQPREALSWLGSSAAAISWAFALMSALLTTALVIPNPAELLHRLLLGLFQGVAIIFSGALGLLLWLMGALFPGVLALACAANLMTALALTALNARLYANFCLRE
ncbi:MAG: putative ABC exporter domain-containing protein [Fimbriimonadales bacterium]|nr:MAG: hypothetical protein KatS3mg018_0637 [Fimbriimonadales bacterium]